MSKRAAKSRLDSFVRTVKEYYRTHGRHALPWRKTKHPYRILVSEIMLQQTQVARVEEKYRSFIRYFPTLRLLAAAPLSVVLAQWSGLGYNRRAKFLHDLARTVVREHRGRLPRTVEALESLPGVGPYTARAVAAFAYDMPVVFIETNIRTVFIHHFFPRTPSVSDQVLLPLIEQTLDKNHPAAWYAALMDYGSFLKQEGSRVHRKSTQYKKQPPLKGSKREVRGAILKSLVKGARTQQMLEKETGFSLQRIAEALKALLAEGIIVRTGCRYALG